MPLLIHLNVEEIPAVWTHSSVNTANKSKVDWQFSGLGAFDAETATFLLIFLSVTPSVSCRQRQFHPWWLTHLESLIEFRVDQKRREVIEIGNECSFTKTVYPIQSCRPDFPLFDSFWRWQSNFIHHRHTAQAPSGHPCCTTILAGSCKLYPLCFSAANQGTNNPEPLVSCFTFCVCFRDKMQFWDP